MERLGRSLGLPLPTLEAIGQDERCCERFAQALQEGTLPCFLGRLAAGLACGTPAPGSPREVPS